MLHFYFDENLPGRLARAARRRGLDALNSHEVGRNKAHDDEQLLWAAERGRCLVTRDVRDLVNLTRLFAEDRQPHAGVVIVPRSLPDRDIGGIVEALVALAESYEDGLPSYTVAYLAPQSRP